MIGVQGGEPLGRGKGSCHLKLELELELHLAQAAGIQAPLNHKDV